jgi:hypothetical protein
VETIAGAPTQNDRRPAPEEDQDVRRGLASALLCTAVLCVSLPAMAAAPAAPPRGPDTGPAARPKGGYADLNKLPDWGGVWITKRPAPGAVRERPQPKGKYAEQLKEAIRQADLNNGETPRTRSYCAAPGLPGIMGTGQYPMEILFTPGRVTSLHEAWTGERRIFTDGRKHTPIDELDPSFYGESIGHWEGDVLVVNTIGFKTDTTIATGLGHSDKMVIDERWYLDPADPNTLVVDMVLTDTEALETPFKTQYRYGRRRDIDLLEFYCAENERNALNEKGLAGTDHD